MLATFPGGAEIERNFSFLQMFSSGRRQPTWSLMKVRLDGLCAEAACAGGADCHLLRSSAAAFAGCNSNAGGTNDSLWKKIKVIPDGAATKVQDKKQLAVGFRRFVSRV